MQAPLIPSELPALRRGLMVSLLLHLVLGTLAVFVFKPPHHVDTELVDIEVAPLPPKAEALPAEVAKPPDQPPAAGSDDVAAASTTPPPPAETLAIDAGVDAPPDAAPDAPPDAPPDAKPDARPKPDASMDAAEPMVASVDAGSPDSAEVAMLDAADAAILAEVDAGSDAGSGSAAAVASSGDADATGDAAIVGTAGSGQGSGSGSGEGSGSGSAVASIALATGSGSGVPGQTDEPAVEGAPTTAGTAANLLTYFPQGHILTALIRFDRLRGTEWAAQTERLLFPMPDYRLLFRGADARITDKLETLVISTPAPRDATATTLVGRTALGRAALRDFLGASSPVTWSTAKGGLLGKRTGRMFPGDKRVILSPFKSWFLLAQPKDLGALTSPAPGNLDAIEASGRLPAWIGGIRKIEAESGGDKRGPALVVTISLGGKRVDLGDNDFGLGIKTLPTPDRLSLAMELVTQGWLVRGNMRFGAERDAIEFIAAADSVRDRVGDSTAIQMVIGKPLARVIKNLSFARTGGRVSYATSISIADARAILAAVAQQLDGYFGP